MKLKAHSKYLLRSVKADFSRIFAILIIVMLGVGFLTGLLQTGDDLHLSADHYFKTTNRADITLRSTTGFDKDTLDDLVSKIEHKTYNYTQEVESEVEIEANISNAQLIYQDLSLDGDKLTIVEGRMVEAEGECLILTSNKNLNSHPLLSTIKLNYMGQKFDYKIVGKVKSSTYFTTSVITSSISNRRLNEIIYLDLNVESNLPQGSIYSSISFGFDYPFHTFSSNYSRFINEKSKAIEKIIAESLDQKESQQIYVLDRSSDLYFSILQSDISKLITISKIFPVFFFLIAVLVSSASISRLITTDRMMMGTFKGLGYSKKTIAKKYLFYGLFAVVVGSILGVIVGIFALPFLVFILYTPLYQIPQLVYSFNPLSILLIVFLMGIPILGIILFEILKELRQETALLQSDKDPKPGKMILIERFRPLWKKIPFRYKSMLRNVFRYKKNLVMMILGVGGCSALLLTGFSMNDSLQAFTKTQYQDIYKYDFIVESLEEVKLTERFDSLSEAVYLDGLTIDKDGAYNFSLLQGADLDSYINFDKKVKFDENSVILTKQLQERFKIKIGSTFTVSQQGQQSDFTLTGVTSNLVGNSIYLGSKVKHDLKILNYSYIGIKKFKRSQDSETFIKELLKLNGVKNVIYTANSLETYETLLGNMIYIVLLLVGLSGLLLITVMYNIVDINISSRKKEISTLKVLGYQKKELLLYIFREMIFMTLLGIGVGLGLGIMLHDFILHSLNSPGLVFSTYINPLSYILTLFITVAFSLLVTAILGGKIAKIDMMASLKSVD